MNKERLINIIIKPWITEKTGRLEANSCYVFIVVKDATKREIAQAIKMLFNVDVKSVRTMIVKGVTKQSGLSKGKTKSYKKAAVSLQPGQIIQLSKLSTKTK